MSIITSSSFAKALWPGVNSWYGKEYSEFPVEYTDLFETQSTGRAYEEDIGITSFGLAQVKPEGQAITYDSESQAFITRYSPVVYGLGFIVTREIFEDDQYDVVGQRRARGLAFSMRQTKEIVGANVYNRATNGSYLGGDGSSLVSTTHANFAGGTWSNRSSTDAALSEAALEQAVIDIGKWTNDRGLRIKVVPQSLHIPIDLEFEANRILNSPYRKGTPNNDINVLYMEGRFPKGIKTNHYFTSTTNWFLRTNVKDGMKCMQRRAMEFGIDNDFDTENAKFKATERYAFGWTDARAVYGSNGA
jgi:hypothetical protein